MSLHDILRGDVMPLSGIAVALGRNSYDPPAPVVPVFDIHCRTKVLHDSAGSSGSGIIRFNRSKNRLDLIPTTPLSSGTYPIVTAVIFDAYNTSTSTISSSPTTLNLDTERYNSHPDLYVLNSSDEVQFNMAGDYLIEYAASLANDSTATRTSCLVFIALQPAGGAYGEVAGSRSYTYNRDSTNGQHTCNARVILTIAVGDMIRLRGQILAGTASITQLANGTRLTIRKLA